MPPHSVIWCNLSYGLRRQQQVAAETFGLNTETGYHQCYAFALVQVRMNDQVIFGSVGDSTKGQFLHCSTYLLERTGQHLHCK